MADGLPFCVRPAGLEDLPHAARDRASVHPHRVLPIVILLAGLSISPASVRAQISVPGTPLGLSKASPSVSANVPTVRVSAAPSTKARSAPSGPARSDSVQFLPDTYGTRTPASIALKDAGARQRLADGGMLWRVHIEAPGARGLRFMYDRFRLPPGARFFVYDPEGAVVQGAFTERNNARHGGFSTGLTPGARAVLEYYEPPDAAFSGRIRVATVVRAEDRPYPTAPLSGVPYDAEALGCSINTACPEGDAWSKEARATVLIDRGGSTCSGVLLNNTAEDFSPYILTAHHCSSPAVGDTLDWLVTFNYASPACADPDTQPPKYSMTGVVVRAAQSGWQEDYALLELLNPIPASYEAYYAGWSRTATPPQRGITLGHPRGDIQKIAFDDDVLTDLGARWLATFDRGTIEGGSSGAPLFDDQHRMVGHVRGAWSIDFDACSGPDGDDNDATIVFPKLAHIWDAGPAGLRVRDFLDPAGLNPIRLEGLDSAPSDSSAARAWINEVDTRTANATDEDDAEFVELAGPAGLSLAGYQLDVYACAAGTAELQFTEAIEAAPPLSPDDGQTGFFVVGGSGLPDALVDHPFSANAPNRLPDGHGLIVLRAPDGREVFDYQYDAPGDADAGACPVSRTTRSRADDYSYDPQLVRAMTTDAEAKVALGTTAIGFQQVHTPAAEDFASEGIVPSPGRKNNTAIPVELTNFRAVVDGETVHLSWTTASETGNAGFEVQHAMEGDFVTRAFVEGHGTTTRAQTYGHTTSDLLAGTHRFRLRQVDVDGTTSYSPVVEVTVASSASFQLSRPHPNPFHQTASLTLTVAQSQHVEVLLYDVLGRRVAVLHDGTIPAQRPVALQVDARSLSSGLYIVRVTAEQFMASRKMTLLR